MPKPRGNTRGWSTKPKDGSHAGRPPLPDGKRPNHSSRAYAGEWELIRRFADLVKKNYEKAASALNWAYFQDTVQTFERVNDEAHKAAGDDSKLHVVK